MDGKAGRNALLPDEQEDIEWKVPESWKGAHSLLVKAVVAVDAGTLIANARHFPKQVVALLLSKFVSFS